MRLGKHSLCGSLPASIPSLACPQGLALVLALPNMKLAQLKRRINKRPGILFVRFNPSRFPSSLVRNFCSSVYIILIESYIRAYKYHSWMELQIHMKAVIIQSVLNSDKRKQPALILPNPASSTCPLLASLCFLVNVDQFWDFLLSTMGDEQLEFMTARGDG